MTAKKTRLDVALVERGLAASRERARALIMAGQVRVDGQVISKAGTDINTDAAIELDLGDHPYVSRGGVKLAQALDDFEIDPSGKQALDVGASTGGFTDVLLRRDVASVIALDVGHGQLAWKLRTDPRVEVHDGVNARRLTTVDVPHPVDLVVIDVSFISLDHIFPALTSFLAPNADIVALVKPQFEAGREEVGKHGLVTDPAVHEAVITKVTSQARAAGLICVAVKPSVITGATGNQEFFAHFRRS